MVHSLKWSNRTKLCPGTLCCLHVCSTQCICSVHSGPFFISYCASKLYFCRARRMHCRHFGDLCISFLKTGTGQIYRMTKRLPAFLFLFARNLFLCQWKHEKHSKWADRPVEVLLPGPTGSHYTARWQAAFWMIWCIRWLSGILSNSTNWILCYVAHELQLLTHLFGSLEDMDCFL